ncbi:hypothetical protein BT63DRAFT_459610 [Microthyrium microscopicum]|uniref:Acyltransferase 3 domain-containing protein n=1 Tax=Microthyrium microscopicum TaxID=703497 RepID=A0A6A6U075_9PEZI|nr:hypothetical protein BT63DRAFT_459610 [Microthyrium microscopicum]
MTPSSEEQHLLTEEYLQLDEESRVPDNVLRLYHNEKPNQESYAGALLRLSSKCPNIHWTLRAIGLTLLPTFLHPTSKDEEVKPLRRTACLDGLRGVAAFFVLNFHFYGAFLNANGGYVVGDPSLARFWNLPIVKVVSNGTAMVHIFFVISGYILSLRSLQQIRKRNLEGVLVTLSSSTLRRGIRLFGPTTLALSIEAFALWMGLFEFSRPNMDLIPWEQSHFPPRLESAGEHLSLLRRVVWALSNFFDWNPYYPIELDGNLWTIGIEYRCSVALFVTLLAFARIHNPRMRRPILAFLTAMCISYQRWDFVLFLAGMMLADFDTWADDQDIKTTTSHKMFWGIVTLIGLFFASSPFGYAERAWGFGAITQFGAKVYYLEPYHFAESIGAIILVLAAMHAYHLNWVLTTSVVQYLGRISYQLYIVHGPLIRAWGFTIVPLFWRALSDSTPQRGETPYVVGVVLGYLAYLPVAICLADIYMRLLDDNCVRLARWLEKKLTTES